VHGKSRLSSLQQSIPCCACMSFTGRIQPYGQWLYDQKTHNRSNGSETNRDQDRTNNRDPAEIVAAQVGDDLHHDKPYDVVHHSRTGKHNA
jgi:hypothetical protein